VVSKAAQGLIRTKPKQMRTIDYNGTGVWSLEVIRQRYAAYSDVLNVRTPMTLTPMRTTDDGIERIYPVIEQVLDGSIEDDAACVAILVDLVCTEQRFMWGKIFKDRAARKLRGAALTDAQILRLRRHTVAQLERGYVTPEFKTLSRLMRRIGLGAEREKLALIRARGPRVTYYLAYFRLFAA